MSVRRSAPVVVVAGLSAILSGCSAEPPSPTRPAIESEAPRPSSTAAPTPKPAPTPAPPPGAAAPPSDRTVTEIVVRPEHLDLVNRRGEVVSSLSYDADAAVFVEQLGAALGGAATVEERPGGHEWSPWTRYAWPGVQVADDHEPDGFAQDLNLSVRFTHPVVGNGIAVSTVQGFQPGDDLEAFAGELGAPWSDEGVNEFPAETGPEIGPRAPAEWTGAGWGYANAYAVSVNQWPGTGPEVTSVIVAPWNFGIGHV